MDAPPATLTPEFKACYTAPVIRQAVADLLLAYAWVIVAVLACIAAVLPLVIVCQWLGI